VFDEGHPKKAANNCAPVVFMVDEGGGGWKEAELEKEMRFYALKRY
jgi:hypothetical protein